MRDFRNVWWKAFAKGFAEGFAEDSRKAFYTFGIGASREVLRKVLRNVLTEGFLSRRALPAVPRGRFRGRFSWKVMGKVLQKVSAESFKNVTLSQQNNIVCGVTFWFGE